MLFKVRFSALGIVAALSLSSHAREPVSGVSRLNLNGAEVQFSLESYQCTIASIVNSTHTGVNRTLADSCPVPKLHGVNFGGWLLSEPW